MTDYKKQRKKRKEKKNLKIPKTFNLLDGEYKFKLVKSKAIDYKNALGGKQEILAEIHHEKKQIFMDKILRPKNRERSLWHELAHHFAEYYRLGNNEMFAEALTKFIINLNKQIGYKKPQWLKKKKVN